MVKGDNMLNIEVTLNSYPPEEKLIDLPDIPTEQYPILP